MWHNLLDLNLSPLNLILRATIVYFAVLILLRVSGKRELGQMSATDFVAILLISNAVQNSMNGGDNSLAGGLLLALVLIVLSIFVSYLTYKSRLFRTLFEGTPTLLIHKGQMIKKNMEHERMSESELKALLRKQGLHELRHVETAILESDGTLSINRIPETPG